MGEIKEDLVVHKLEESYKSEDEQIVVTEADQNDSFEFPSTKIRTSTADSSVSADLNRSLKKFSKVQLNDGRGPVSVFFQTDVDLMVQHLAFS